MRLNRFMIRPLVEQGLREELNAGDTTGGFLVWDELGGQWIALVPFFWLSRDSRWVLVAFALFRLFDIWKPWPVSWADRQVKGGIGVMLDDVIAGVLAAIVLSVGLRVVS